jgi:hypothetical protein
MCKRRKALLWSLFGILIVFAIILLSTQPRHPDTQPIYKGRSLAQWLDVAARHRINGYFETFQKGRPPSKDATPEQIHEAEESVRAIGTNALPSLLEWISYKPTPFKRCYRGTLNLLPLPDHIRRVLWAPDRNEMRSWLAVQGFRMLNTNALPAVGVLSDLLKDTNHPYIQISAKFALLAITNVPATSNASN